MLKNKFVGKKKYKTRNANLLENSFKKTHIFGTLNCWKVIFLEFLNLETNIRDPGYYFQNIKFPIIYILINYLSMILYQHFPKTICFGQFVFQQIDCLLFISIKIFYNKLTFSKFYFPSNNFEFNYF